MILILLSGFWMKLEKMGALMNTNNNKLLGIYDELGTFLEQINAYCGKGLSESHKLAHFYPYIMQNHGNERYRYT